jgi:hypothetical protein
MPDPRKDVKLEIREVVRDIAKKPHVLIRVRLTGWHFPERALEPFVLIGTAVSKFLLIGYDGTTADAYFDVRPPAAKRVSFGYGKIISWDFDVAVNPADIDRLDRARLPKGFIDLLRLRSSSPSRRPKSITKKRKAVDS